jgi:hypothetical protein
VNNGGVLVVMSSKPLKDEPHCPMKSVAEMTSHVGFFSAYQDKGLNWLNNHMTFTIHFGICSLELDGIARHSRSIKYIRNNVSRKLRCSPLHSQNI